jgi:hypothetical protein
MGTMYYIGLNVNVDRVRNITNKCPCDPTRCRRRTLTSSAKLIR